MTVITKPIKRRLKKFEDYKVNPSPFLTPLEPLFVYLLGLLWADGHIDNKRRNCLIVFRQALPQGDHFLNLFLKTGDWKFYKYKTRWSDSLSIKTNNYYLCNFLIENDYLIKSQASPDKILSIIPENLHNFFYLGVIDGDGYWYVNHKNRCYQFNITSSINQNWNYMINLCSKLDIKYKIENRSKLNNKGKLNEFSRFRITSKTPFLKLRDYIYKEKVGRDLALPTKLTKAFSI